MGDAVSRGYVDAFHARHDEKRVALDLNPRPALFARAELEKAHSRAECALNPSRRSCRLKLGLVDWGEESVSLWDELFGLMGDKCGAAGEQFTDAARRRSNCVLLIRQHKGC